MHLSSVGKHVEQGAKQSGIHMFPVRVTPVLQTVQESGSSSHSTHGSEQG